MAPSQRDDARRRRAEELRRRAEREQRRRRLIGVVGVALAVVVAVAVVLTVVLTGGDDEPAASPSSSATASSTPSAAASTAPADDPCPDPGTQPVAQPPQFDAPPEAGSSDATSAVVSTSCGDITVELLPDAAPQAVASFAFLAEQDFYADSICHRLVTSGIFVLQCGDPTATGSGGPGYSFGPVENAPADDVYPAGTLAMARVGDDAGSNGSQFFVVYEDSTIPSDSAGGYTVFGRVTEGLDVVQTIAAGGTAADGVAPARPITIEGVTAQ